MPAERALVLDFGGVLTRTLFETHDETERALGLPPGTLTWQGPFHPETDGLWQAMQRGEISERDYWRERAREVGALLGEHWDSPAELIRRARGGEPAAMIRPEAVEAVGEARAAGHRLAILSNELDLFYGAGFRERLPLLEAFDAIVDASHTGVPKPDPAAYRAVTKALGVPASACVFLDDQPANVEGARAAGMAALQFDVARPGASFRGALARLGEAAAGGP